MDKCVAADTGSSLLSVTDCLVREKCSFSSTLAGAAGKGDRFCLYLGHRVRHSQHSIACRTLPVSLNLLFTSLFALQDKVTANTYSTDTVCMIILGCASWSQGSKDWTSCCDRKALAGVHDEGCPDDWPGDACGAKDGDARNSCCSSKANKGIYDPGCDMGEKCSTWPPQHRKVRLLYDCVKWV